MLFVVIEPKKGRRFTDSIQAYWNMVRTKDPLLKEAAVKLEGKQHPSSEYFYRRNEK